MPLNHFAYNGKNGFVTQIFEKTVVFNDPIASGLNTLQDLIINPEVWGANDPTGAYGGGSVKIIYLSIHNRSIDDPLHMYANHENGKSDRSVFDVYVPPQGTSVIFTPDLPYITHVGSSDDQTNEIFNVSVRKSGYMTSERIACRVFVTFSWSY